MNHHGGDAFDVNFHYHHAHDKLGKLPGMMMRRTSKGEVNSTNEAGAEWNGALGTKAATTKSKTKRLRLQRTQSKMRWVPGNSSGFVLPLES